MMNKIISSIILATVCCTANAQVKLVPGKNIVAKNLIKSQHYQMNWYMLRDSTKMQLGTVHTQILPAKDKITVITQVKINNTDATWIDSTQVERSSLKPLYHSSYNAQRDMVLNFGNTVTGYYLDKKQNAKTSISEQPAEKYFDSNFYPILLGWLPLKQGYTQDVAIYDYNPTGKTGVLKASIVKVEDGTFTSKLLGVRNTWEVTVVDEIGTGSSTYSIDKETRTLWMQKIQSTSRIFTLELNENVNL